MTASEVTKALHGVIAEPNGFENRLTFSGPTQFLPSVFDVTSLAAGCVATAAIAAGDLWATRGGPAPTPVNVDRGHAASIFRGERYLRRDGEPVPAWDPISGYYTALDGRWLQLHANYPHHRAGIIALLGCEDTRQAVEAAIGSSWTAQALEDALAARGMCCTMLRTRDEWLAHPQGQAVASQPIATLSDLISGAPSPLTLNPDRPLSGVRVLDLTRVIAGPVCTRVLAQHGADVLKVNSPNLPTVDVSVIDTGFGKRTCHLNLDQSADRDTLMDLAAEADVFVQGYRHGALRARGLSPEDIAAVNPDIVYVSLSAFGTTGPWAERRGFDSLTQTASGIGAAGAAAADAAGTRPLPAQALDHGAGWLMAAGAMAALRLRHQRGGSRHFQTSLAQIGHFLAELGPVDALDVPDPTSDDVSQWLDEIESDFGTLTHLTPPGRIDGIRGYDSPPVKLGSHPPAWR
jgi:crotonobetainyl-CoA:carnitine CoA-transferase CaiB-like acyl-CoA transferase